MKYKISSGMTNFGLICITIIYIPLQIVVVNIGISFLLSVSPFVIYVSGLIFYFRLHSVYIDKNNFYIKPLWKNSITIPKNKVQGIRRISGQIYSIELLNGQSYRYLGHTFDFYKEALGFRETITDKIRLERLFRTYFND